MSKIQLLVSVKNASEAKAAAVGGADIIDVKDPNQGSLGFAGWSAIRDVNEVVRAQSLIVSAALGELTEWQDRRADLDRESLPRLAFAKIGLAFAEPVRATPGGPASVSHWEQDWLSVRNRLTNVDQWVAVAYSDFAACDAPSPEDVLQAAIRTECRILLLDTFVKDGRTTFDHLATSQLKGLIRLSHESGLKIAIAGQVTANDVSVIAELKPDIVAVRGAVCEHQDRKRSVVASEVSRLKTAIDSI